MALINFGVAFRNSGALTAGLTPSWSSLFRLSDGTSVASPGTVAPITALGGGLYKIAYDPEGADGELFGVLDGGATITQASERYAEVLLAQDSSRSLRLDAAVSSRAAPGAAMTLSDGAITAAKIATDAITADKIATDAIGASELAASAVAEIQAGLSTLDAAGVRAAVGLASANLDTQLASLETNTNDLPTMVENDGLGTARFTAAALAQAPTATLVGGENTLTALDTGIDGLVGLFVGDRYSLVLKTLLGNAPAPGTGATWTASTTDEATGAAISSDVSLTALNEALGYFSYPLAANDTVSARRVKLTVKRVQGSDVRIFGPLVLNVRDR